MEPDPMSETLDIKWQGEACAPLKGAFHTAVLHEGKVYVGGGNEPGMMPSYKIQIYSLMNNSWSPTPIETPYCEFAMTTLNNQLIIAGGKNESVKVTNKVLNGVQLNEYSKMITPRSSATAAGHLGMLIIAGGKDEQDRRLASTELFDSTSEQWCTVNELPLLHEGQQSVIVNNMLYLLGGVNKDGYASQIVLAASLNTLSDHTLKWRFCKDTLWSRSTPINISGRHLLTIGGWKITGDTFTSDIHMFNELSRRWEVMGQFPLALSGVAAVSVGNKKVFAVGGYDGQRYTDRAWIGLCVSQ